jgi:hypothetical protein
MDVKQEKYEKAGCAHIDAIDWNVARFTATIPIRVGSEICAASMGVGPLLYALYDSNATSLARHYYIGFSLDNEYTHPPRYSHDNPYAAVTILGLTSGRNASPISLVCPISQPRA